MAGLLLIMSAVFLPETLRKQRYKQTTTEQEKEDLVIQAPSFLTTLKVSFKPMIVMLYDPTVNLLTVYNSVIFACLYFLVKYIYLTQFFGLSFILFYMYRTQQLQIHLNEFMVTLNGK